MQKKKEVGQAEAWLSAYADAFQKYFPLLDLKKELSEADFSRIEDYSAIEKELVLHDYLAMRHCSVKRELATRQAQTKEMRKWLDDVIDRINDRAEYLYEYRAKQMKRAPDGVSIYGHKLLYTDNAFKDKIKRFLAHGHYRFDR